jgi:hypothetical protein
MATERLSIRKIREILRLKWVLGRSHREIKGAAGVGLATVTDTIARATAAHLDWPAVDALWTVMIVFSTFLAQRLLSQASRQSTSQCSKQRVRQ